MYPLNGPAWSLLFEIAVNITYAATLRFWTPVRITGFIIAIASILILHLCITGTLYGDGGFNWSSVPLGFLRVCYSFPVGVLIYQLYQRGFAFPKIPSWILVGLLPVLFLLPSAVVVPFDVLVGFPLLVAVAVSSEPKSVFAAICNVMGAASYAIYALHEPLHGIIEAALIKAGLHFPPLATDIALIVAIVPISLLMDRFFDGPLRKILTRRLLPTSPS